MKKVLLTGLILLTVSSCGYSIAGFNNSIPVKYYINVVNNNTIDTYIGDIIQLEAERFFLSYNELSSYKQASYFMDINIDNLKYTNPILSATDEASSTNISYDITIIVTDVEGKEIYSYNTTVSKSFTITQNVSTALQNKDQALKDSLQDIFTTFRINISPKVYKKS